MKGRALFRAIAPRLERAHRERIVEMARERDHRLLALERLQHKEWLVAHRDLQYHRACTRRSAAYQRERYQKLEEARRELAAAESHAEQLGLRVFRRKAA